MGGGEAAPVSRSRREYPDRPMLGVGGFIHRDGLVLLILRRFEPNKGRWTLPGGLLELGEAPEEAARREVREELGIEVELEGVLQVANEVIRDEQGRVRYHFVLIDYLMSPLRGEIKLNDESEEYRWFKAEEVESLNTTANTKLIARKYLEERGKRAEGERTE